MSKQTSEYNATTSFISRETLAFDCRSIRQEPQSLRSFSARLKPVRPENTAAVALRLLLANEAQMKYDVITGSKTQNHTHMRVNEEK